MEKLITFKNEHLVYCYIAVYGDIIIDYVRNRDNIVKFYNISTNKYMWETFNPKVNNSIEKIYVNHGRLFIIGNGRCKIFDLTNNLKLLKNIKFTGASKCSFSNDGNTILLVTEASCECKLVNLLTDDGIYDIVESCEINIINDKLYRGLNMGRMIRYYIYDFNLDCIGERNCNVSDMKFNKNSIYDSLYVENSSVFIYNKESDKSFTVDFKDIIHSLASVKGVKIFSNILVVYGKRLSDNNNGFIFHIYEIIDDKETIKYLGNIPTGDIVYFDNKMILSQDSYARYSIYSLKEFKK